MTFLRILRGAARSSDSPGELGDSPGPWKRTVEFTALALALLGFLVLGMVNGVSQTLLLVAGLLLIPGAILSRQPNPPLYTRAWSLATILFVIASLILARWNERAAIQTLANLCVFLQIHHAFNYRKPRDYFTIWTLTLMMFLLVPLSEGTPPLAYAVLLVIMLSASVWHFGALGWMADSRAESALIVPRIGRGSVVYDRAGSAPAPSDPRFAVRVFSRAWNRLAAAALVLTTLAFFLLPRPLLPPAIRDAESAEAARARQSLLTGLTQSIDLYQITSLHLDPTVAVRLSGSPILRMGTTRLRAGTLDWFDGNRWEHSTTFAGGARLQRHPDPPEFRVSEIPQATESTRGFHRVRVTTFDLSIRALFTLPETIGLGGLPGEVWLNEDGSLVTWPITPEQYMLFLRPEPLVEPRADPPASAGAPFERYLQLHDRIDPAWLESRAGTLAEGASTDLEKARRVETYFKRQGAYTLDLRSGKGEDGLALIRRFIDSPHPQGHCELFATSMALLARALGLPSRVVTGFLGGVYDERTDELILRYQDAHAWVEVWIPDRGWMTFDPTPPAPLVSFSDRLPFLQIRQWFGTVLDAWQRVARDYGGNSQRRALAWLGDHVDRLLSPLFPQGGGGALERIADSFRQPVVRWMAVGLLGVNLAVILFWRRSRRMLGALLRRPTTLQRQQAESYWKSIRQSLLVAAGAPDPSPPAGLTLTEYLLGEARRNGVPWEPLDSAVALYESRRFGARPWSFEDQRVFDSFLRPLAR